MEKPENWVITAVYGVARMNLGLDYTLVCRDRTRTSICFRKSGRVCYTQNGQKIYNDAYHFVLLPKGADYTVEILEPSEAIMVDVELECDHEIQCISLLPDTDAFRMASELEHHWIYRTPNYRPRCMAILYELLASAYSTDAPYCNREKYLLVEPAIRFLDSHLADPSLRTETLAEVCGLSMPYFRKLFRLIYRMPIAEYIERVRIRRAKALLQTPGETVGSVAEKVGYRNIYHFSRVFKKATGSTPSAFMHRSPERFLPNPHPEKP